MTRHPVTDLGFARVDHHRVVRQGQMELVYAPGKTTNQILSIVQSMLDDGEGSVVVTRLAGRTVRRVLAGVRSAAQDRGLAVEWRERPGILAIPRGVPDVRGAVLILTAGTADEPVAEEIELIARLLGTTTRVIRDVGVAGLHRLLVELPALEDADAIVVVAGMEGALASVVGGLAQVPVIACPTSVGYGANFGGLTALLSMMVSCAPGVAVVNVDDGVGAGTIAALIARGRDRRVARSSE
ncbi:MAG TPA: nickel pincer cofactor biosynthesis protein LarB [Patescibacteria group bacterium]|nr:nickel pincer cofactor biosynthesis protein LarB [Patescibacteria group bacterium]